MELVKLLLLLCLVISCLYSSSAVQRYRRRNWANVLSRNGGELNDNCVCYPRGDPNYLTPSVLHPNDRSVKRLVVYIYEGDQPSDLKLYIPGQKNQQLIPDLPLDADGEVIPVSNEPIQNLFNKNPNVINVAKPSTKPKQIYPNQYDHEYPGLPGDYPVDYPVKKLLKPHSPINHPIVPDNGKTPLPDYSVHYPGHIETDNESNEIPQYPTNYYPLINGKDHENPEIWLNNFQPHKKDDYDDGVILRPESLVNYPIYKPKHYDPSINTRPDLPSPGSYNSEIPKTDVPINVNYGNNEIPRPGYASEPTIYPGREYDSAEILNPNYPIQKEKGRLRPEISVYIPITDNDEGEITNPDYNLYPVQSDIISPAFSPKYPTKKPEDDDTISGLEFSVFYPNDADNFQKKYPIIHPTTERDFEEGNYYPVLNEKQYYDRLPRPHYANKNNQMPQNVPHDIWYDQHKPQTTGVKTIYTGEVPIGTQPRPQIYDDYSEISDSFKKPFNIKPTSESPVLAVDLPNALGVGDQKVPVDKFDEWLNEQIMKVPKNGYNTIDVQSLKILIEKTLAENGMHMTDNGVLQDSKGNVLNIQNLKLRPILIGDAVQTKNIWNDKKKYNEKFQIPKNLPYLEGVLITLVYPPKILGIIPLGVIYLPRDMPDTPAIAMANKQISNNDIKFNTDSIMNKNNGLVNNDNMALNTDKIMTNDEVVMVNNDIKKDDIVSDHNDGDIVSTNIVVPVQEDTMNAGTLIYNDKETMNNRDLMMNMMNKDMMINNKKNPSNNDILLNNHKMINNGVMWPGKSSKSVRYFPGKTIKYICITASCNQRKAILSNTKSTAYRLQTTEGLNQRNNTQKQNKNFLRIGENKIKNVKQTRKFPQLTLSDLDRLANFIKAFRKKTLNQKLDDDDPKIDPKKPGIGEKDNEKEKNEESHGFRIIGGNAATSSGTPVSNKGRSGLEE